MAKKGYIQKKHITTWLHTLLSCVHDDEDFQRTLVDILKEKQNLLISGQNIKTLNGQSLLGEGNIVITGGTADGPSDDGGNTPSTSPLFEIALRDEYSPSATYGFFHIVTYEGSSYVCKSKEPISGIVPTNTGYWQLLALRGEPGQKGDDGKPGPKGDDGDSSAVEAILADILAEIRNMPIEDAAIAAQIAANTAEIKSKADKKEVEALGRHVDEILSANAVIGDMIPADEYTNVYIVGEVADTLNKVERPDTYYCRRYAVSAGQMVAVTMYRRNEDWYWVYFTDDDDVIIGREVHSTETDYGVTNDQLLTVPNGATRMYVHSFQYDIASAKFVTGAGEALHDYADVKRQVYVNKADIARINDTIGRKNYIDGSVFDGLTGTLPDSRFSCSYAIPVMGGRDIVLVSNVPMDASFPDALKEFDADGNEVDHWTSWGAGEERPITLSPDTRYIRVNFLGDGHGSYIMYADGMDIFVPQYEKGSIIRDIADLKDAMVTGMVPGDEKTPLSTEHVFLEGSIGEVISKTERDTYLCKKYAVDGGKQYFVSLTMRNEPWYWCYFVDEHDRILAKYISSTATSYGNVTDELVTAPAGAKYMYIHSFNSTLLYCNDSTTLAGGLIRVGKMANEAKTLADKNTSIFFHQCTTLNNAGDIYTVYAPASLGDVVVWASDIDPIEVSMIEYDEHYNQIDAWTCPFDERTVTISHEETKFVRGVFSYTLKRKQYLIVNGEEIAYTNQIGSGDGAQNALPDFVMSAAKKTYKRLIEWIGDEDAFLLAHITDVHSGGSGKYRHVGYLNELNKLFSFDCLVNGGDIGLDTPDTTGNDEKVYELLANTKNGMNCTSPWIFCRGNHERLVSLDVTGNVFNRSFRRQFQNIKFGDALGNYGYIDFDYKGLRVIFLNTTDAETDIHYGVRKSQLEWLISTLRDTTIGWNVVLTMHLCIDPIGRWKSYPDDADGVVFDALRDIIRCFANKTAGGNASLNLSWDFSSSQSKLVCCLCGDSHFNNFVSRNNVNYIVRQGYGNIDVDEITEGGSTTNFDASSDCCFDVLAVKQSGSAMIFRIGAGNETHDLSFSF